MERPSFSPFWHRVALSRPRLRPHVQITRQHYRRGRWHVVHDPTSNQFYRLNPVAYDFICSLDGDRTVDEAWKLSLTKFADGAPTQNEAIELISQLYTSNLLAVDTTPEIEQLLRRSQDRSARRMKQQLIGFMYFKLPAFNPDALLTALEPIFRPVLSRLGLVAWIALMLFTLIKVLPEWQRIGKGLDSLSNPANWIWMMGTFVLLKLWHELGHGLMCKRFGGQIPETGVMMLVLFPSPYVDASSAWGFPSKWQRAAVGAAGMMFELTAAAIAGLLWLNTAEGTLLKEIFYYAMVSSSISTVFFNANPLMRFDGYFIFSDLIEAPNLMNRSMLMLRYLAVRYLYRVKNLRAPSADPGERVLLTAFGIASVIYRLFLFVLITFFLLGLFFIIGVVLAVWSAVVWFAMPVGGLIKWLSSNASLADRRGKAVLTTIALAAAGVLLLGVVPAPDWRRAVGVVEPRERVGVFAGAEGFVQTVHVRNGEPVKRGDAIVTLDNPELASQLEYARAQVQILEMQQREALAANDPSAALVAARQAQVWSQQASEHQRRIGELVIRSPIDGEVVAADPGQFAGAHLRIGQQLCEVIDRSQVRVAATLTQTEGEWMYGLNQGEYSVRMRPAGDVWRVIDGAGIRILPAGQKVLPHAALGMVGGGEVVTHTNDPSGRGSVRETFTMYVDVAPDKLALLTPGQRVHLSITLPSKPILTQVWDRFAKALQGKVNL